MSHIFIHSQLFYVGHITKSIFVTRAAVDYATETAIKRLTLEHQLCVKHDLCLFKASHCFFLKL